MISKIIYKIRKMENKNNMLKNEDIERTNLEIVPIQFFIRKKEFQSQKTKKSF